VRRQSEEVVQGRLLLDPGVSGAVVESFRGERRCPPTPSPVAEREVLQLIAKEPAAANKELPNLLGISGQDGGDSPHRTHDQARHHHTARLGPLRDSAPGDRRATEHRLIDA